MMLLLCGVEDLNDCLPFVPKARIKDEGSEQRVKV